jgi:hypothetical protein
MTNRYTFLFAIAFPATLSAQQYCSPTFANGCVLWTNQSINVGTLAWTNADCTVSDHTSLSTAITAGVPTTMTVVSGNWTGCAVWVDLNNDYTFQDTENLHYEYVGGDPSYTYTFDLTIPANTPTGAYRMRVIAPWGSDGFLNTNVNGFGPCGSYQYGNFDDFTLDVSGSTGIAEVAKPGVSVFPTPTLDVVNVIGFDGRRIDRVVVRSADGRLVADRTYASGPVGVDLSTERSGLYVLQCWSGAAFALVPVLKQ